MLEIGSVVDGKYKILNQIGRGGMSVVYLAINERANKPWAIKEVRKDGVSNYEIVRQNLIAETDILKHLSHPNLPSIIDVIDRDDTFLIVMDYIEGKPLSEKLKNEGAQPQEKVVAWAKQICDVLGYLHSRKPPIVYRDMKPSNVMLQSDGTVKIIDFGTAREYKSGSSGDTVVLGTRGYAAPEQYGGLGQTDARTDIYCLGSTLYHLLTGDDPCLHPFQYDPIRKWNPALSSGLEDIIFKCLQHNREDRYQSCAELLYALEHYEELDHAYKKAQGRKWRLFLTAASLTLGCLLSCVGFKVAESKATSSSYAGYIEAAESASSEDEKIENYQNAINLDPGNKEAYLELLENAFLADENETDFSREEAAKMTEILNYRGSNKKDNKSYLKENANDYGEFAYQLGLAYYYYYDVNGNKPGSEVWFNAATENDGSLTESQKERAKGLGKIAGYYTILDNPDKTGDSETDYADYWEDMNELVNGDIAEKDTPQTALQMYRDMAYQIYINAEKFKEDDISKASLQAKLNDIAEWTENIQAVKSGSREEIENEKEEVLNLVDEATQAVDMAFSTQDANLTNETGGGEDE